VRIEARNEPAKHEREASAKATAKTPLRKNKCKSNDKCLDNASRLIEVALSGSPKKASGFAGGSYNSAIYNQNAHNDWQLP
jgi:hypothetical protein